jgi:serine protease inhibitor
MNSRDDEVWSGRETAARNLNRFFMLDVLRQWTFMIENRIREPAMTLSPWVLMSTMLMCCHAVGAETLDSTLEDIERASHVDGRYSRELINDLQAGYRAILRKIRSEQRQDFLQISHSIWIPSELPFENQYAVNVAQSVGAQIFRAHDMSSTALHSWVQNQVQEYELQCDFPNVSSSKVVMLSLLRLSTTWTHPFDGKYTEKHTIFCPDVSMDSVQRLDLMVQRNTFPYHENAHFKAVSLSTNSTLECLCILPTGSLHSLLKSLSEDNGFLFKPMKGEKRKLVVKMPSFRIAEGDDISEVLEHTFIFRRLLDIQAHYSRMTKAKTSIRHIIHKNLLSITEEGINTRGTQQCVRSEILKPEPNEQILEFAKSFVFLVRDRERCDIVLATVVHGTYPLSPRQANLRPTTHSAGALSPRQTNLRPTTCPASAAHLYAPTSLGPRTPTDNGTTALPPSAREEAVISALMAAEHARVAAAAAQQKLRVGGGGSGWEMLLGPQLESTRSTSTNMPLPHDSAVSRPPNNGSVYMNGQQQSTHMNGQQQSMTPATKGARVILSPVIFSEGGEQMEWKRVKEWSGERRRGETNGEDTLEVLGTEGGHLPQKMTVGDDDWAALMREQRARAHLASPLCMCGGGGRGWGCSLTHTCVCVLHLPLFLSHLVSFWMHVYTYDKKHTHTRTHTLYESKPPSISCTDTKMPYNSMAGRRQDEETSGDSRRTPFFEYQNDIS